MKYGPRKHGAASCEVIACKGVPEKMRKDIREVIKVFCEPDARHRGDATALLEEVCREADAKRMILMISVGPYGDAPPLSKAALVQWYSETFDFRPIQAEPLIMARMFNTLRKPVLAEKVSLIITEGIK